MLLVTTADTRFWGEAEPILFLGEWAKPHRMRALWESRPNDTLPYHWDDRAKLFADYAHIQKVYEDALAELRTTLNRRHGVSHSLRYWRILLGPWLYQFLTLLYDRYASVKVAEASGRVHQTLLPELGPIPAVPEINDTLHFLNASAEDTYNLFFFSWFIKFHSSLPWAETKIALNSPAPATTLSRGRARFRNIASLLSRASTQRGTRVALIGTSLKPADELWLHFNFRQPPYMNGDLSVHPVFNRVPSARAELAVGLGDSPLEKLASQWIGPALPNVFVEGYETMVRVATETLPKNPQRVVTGTAWEYSDVFKFWAGQQVERGVPLIGIQHGGHYGTGRFSAMEAHETTIYDRFLTWGWNSPDQSNLVPVPSAKLLRARRTLSHRSPRGPFLWVLMSLARYATQLYSIPMGPQTLRYLEDQITFGKALNDESMKNTLLRLHPQDFGWDWRARLQNALPRLQVSPGQKPYIEELRNSSLVIATYNATTYLESFSANMPTLIFWNPEHWEIRPSALPYFEALREAGILHYSPLSAAAMLNEMGRECTSWWKQPKVQAAKNFFCSRFARVDKNWARDFRSSVLDCPPN